MNAPPPAGCCSQGREMRAACIAARNALAVESFHEDDYAERLTALKAATGPYAEHWQHCIKEGTK